MRHLSEPVCSVAIEKGDQRRVGPSARRLQQAMRENDRVLAHGEMDVSPKETSMVGGIGGGRVREVNFVWRPVDPCDHASCTNPRGEKEFCGLPWGRRAAGQLVTKNRSVTPDLQIDTAGLVD